MRSLEEALRSARLERLWVTILRYVRIFMNHLDGYIERAYRLSGYSIPTNTVRTLMLYSLMLAPASLIGLLVSLGTGVAIVFAVLLGISMAVFASVVAYMTAKVSIRAVHFNRNLPTTLLTAIPLLGSGLTLTDVIRNLATTERDPVISREFRLILREVDEGGVDIVTALRRSIERVPSPMYADVAGIITESYGVSSELADILLLKLDYLIRERQVRLRSLVQSLAIVVEIYLVAVLLLPVLLVLIALSLSPLGPLQLGPVTLDVNAILLGTFLIYSPLVGYMFYLLLGAMLGGT